MRYYVEINGHEEQVEVVRQRDDLLIEHAGERFRVNARTIVNGSRYSLLVDGKSLDIIVEIDRASMTVILNGRSHRLRVEDDRERAARRVMAAKVVTGHQVVKSPMPGIVRAIHVAEGQHVKKGTSLLILEAMKMENEIAAEVEGMVEELHVKTGMAVDQDDALLKISPSAVAS